MMQIACARWIPLLLLLLVHGSSADLDGRWLLVQLSGEAASILKHRPTTHREETDWAELGELHRDSHLHEHGAVSVYYHHQGRTLHRVTQPDPRVLIAEGLRPDGTLYGRMHNQTAGSLAVTVPSDATHLTVEFHAPLGMQGQGRRPSRSHTLAIDRRSKFSTTATTFAVAATKQVVGSPSRHMNLVLVSGGFRSACGSFLW